MKMPRLPFRPNTIGRAALPTSAVRAKRRPGDLEDVVDEADDHERGERVEHDRRHDLVRARERLERAGDEPVDRAAERAGEDRDRERDRGGLARRPRRRRARPREATDEELAGSADVEQPGLEADADRQAGQHERGWRLQACWSALARPAPD